MSWLVIVMIAAGAAVCLVLLFVGAVVAVIVAGVAAAARGEFEPLELDDPLEQATVLENRSQR